MSDSIDFSKIKLIDENNKNIVFGFIRQSHNKLFINCNNNPFYIIPLLINHLRLLFWYNDTDEF